MKQDVPAQTHAHRQQNRQPRWRVKQSYLWIAEKGIPGELRRVPEGEMALPHGRARQLKPGHKQATHVRAAQRHAHRRPQSHRQKEHGQQTQGQNYRE